MRDHNPALEHQVARGREAFELLNGPVFAEALSAVESLFIEEWKNSDHPTAREMAWAKVAGLIEVKRQLRRIVSQGEHAAHSLGE